jgi:hypothetical protein
MKELGNANFTVKMTEGRFRPSERERKREEKKARAQLLYEYLYAFFVF